MLKLNKLAIALAVTFSATTAFAAAVTPTDILNATTLNQAWLSGASAPTQNVMLGFAAGCEANTLAVFHGGTAGAVVPGASNTGNAFAYACKRSGVVSVLYYTNQGGSLNAYSAHVPNDVAGTGFGVNTTLNRLANVASANCSNVGAITVTNQGGTPVYKCESAVINGFTATDNTPKKPAGGFSDVEAALFGVNAAGYGEEKNAGVTQVFGVMASEPLYRAMQVAQGIYTTVALANSGDAGFLPRNAPSISREQYASLVSDPLVSWAPLGVDINKEVIVARRVNTSGTQASSNAFFLGNPCVGNPSTLGKLSPIGADVSDPGFVNVIEGGETNDVRTAISGASANDEFAIGVISLENAAATGRRYLKVEGVHPEAGPNNTVDSFARYTSAQGQYPFQIELKAFVANEAKGTFGETIINNIISGLSTVSCTSVPRGLVLNSASTACPVTNSGTHITKATRKGNNCRPLTWKF
ncbi:MAG: hypothetical protein ACTS9Y_09890 [Methylophilus sp.]|uniref:hypothetical protein n=1 Tax=Methylophilus sp. TaxID=29541 RepID=UPI003FA0807C